MTALAGVAAYVPEGRVPLEHLATRLELDAMQVKVFRRFHGLDRISMAHSLECRGPFLDHRVVELALTMPLRRKLRLRGGRSKVVLKRAFADLLPPAIATRPKMGFGVPIDRWFRGELKDELRSVLLDPVALARGWFRPEEVTRLIDEHVNAQRDHADFVDKLRTQRHITIHHDTIPKANHFLEHEMPELMGSVDKYLDMRLDPNSPIR